MSCSNLLWDAQSIARKKVPTIQDALACCDEKTLLYVIERFYASRLSGWRSASPQQRHVARKRMARALKAMRNCPVKRKEGKGRCVFPYEEFIVHYSSGVCSIERALRAKVVAIPATEHTSNLSSCESDAGLSFACQPWSKALAYRIWLEGPWDCQERYMILANVFWQLTHQGFGERSCGMPTRQGWNSVVSHEKQDPLMGAHALDAFGEMSLAAQPNDANDAFNLRGQFASAGELREAQAVEMGLGVPEALEETYQERLIQRVDRLNQTGKQDFRARVLRFSEKLNAA